MAAKRCVTVLDGGMGHLLRRLGVTVAGEVGSQERFLDVARSNVTNPSLVQRAHKQYIESVEREHVSLKRTLPRVTYFPQTQCWGISYHDELVCVCSRLFKAWGKVFP